MSESLNYKEFKIVQLNWFAYTILARVAKCKLDRAICNIIGERKKTVACEIPSTKKTTKPVTIFKGCSISLLKLNGLKGTSIK